MSAEAFRLRTKIHLLRRVEGVFLLSAFLAAASGCVMVQQTIPAPETPPRPLPFKGRLADGDPAKLPPALQMSLSSTSSVTFHYREELTHDEYHVSRTLSAIYPLTYVGAPLGDYGVTVVASLSITDGDRLLGDYTETVHMSQPYNLYSASTAGELEQAAVAAVRDKVDQRLYSEADRLTEAIASDRKPPAGPAPH
jgi:hypothetical protein